MADNFQIVDSKAINAELDNVIKKTDELVDVFKEFYTISSEINNLYKSGMPKDLSEAKKREADSTRANNKVLSEFERLQKDVVKLQNMEAKSVAVLKEQKRLLNAQNKQDAQITLQQNGSLNNQLGLYNKLQLKLNATTNTLQNLLAKKELGLALSSREEKSIATLTARQQKYDQILKSSDATMGKYGRRVGEYASAFDPLSNSINQLTREAPAFAVSVQTGFLALSNNIPIFFDAVNQIVAKNKVLQAEGKKTGSVLGAIASSLFSWQTALSVGVTLLTIYGKDIVEWGSKILSASKAVNTSKKALEDFNAVKKEASTSASKEIADLEVTYKLMKDESIARKDRLEFAKKLQDLYPKIFGSMTTEQMLLQNTTDKYNTLKDAILATAIAQGVRNKISEATNKFLDKEKENLDRVGQAKIAVQKAGEMGDVVFSGQGETADIVVTTDYRVKRAELALSEARKLRNKDISEYQAYLNTMVKISKGYEVKSLILDKPEKEKEIKVKKSREKQAKDTTDYYALEKAKLEAYYDIIDEVNERRLNQINNDEYTFDIDKIAQRNDVYNTQIANANKYYSELIALAKKYNKETLTIEAKRDDEVGKLQDKQNNNLADSPKALKEKMQSLQEIEDMYLEMSFSEQRRAINNNKLLSTDEKQYLITRLKFKQNKESLELENKILEKDILELETKDKLTLADEKLLATKRKQLQINKEALDQNDKDDEVARINKLIENYKYATEVIKDGLKDLGFENLANDFDALFKKIIDGSFSVKDAVLAVGDAIADGLTVMVNTQKDRTISALDEQLAYSQATTEQELEFIYSRLNGLNALQDATAEQITEREALEDEARTLKEQQQEREKQIAIQKAKAEQRASAQNALINGALGATKTIAQMGFVAGMPYALLSLAFGALQSGIIMAKNPVPEYYVGTSNARQGYAWTQERGAEIHTDRFGNIKTLGDEGGARLTYMDSGDKVYTAEQSRKMIDGLEPNYKSMMFQGGVMPINIDNRVNEDKIIKGVGSEFEKVMKQYDKTNVYELNGKVYKENGKGLPILIGDVEKEKQVIVKVKSKKFRD